MKNGKLHGYDTLPFGYEGELGESLEIGVAQAVQKVYQAKRSKQAKQTKEQETKEAKQTKEHGGK